MDYAIVDELTLLADKMIVVGILHSVAAFWFRKDMETF